MLSTRCQKFCAQSQYPHRSQAAPKEESLWFFAQVGLKKTYALCYTTYESKPARRSLRKGMDAMDDQIMSADRVTAEWRDGKLHIVDEAHLPLFLKHFSDLDA